MHYVIDANVVFDFRDGGLLAKLASLPEHEFIIVDAVWIEEIDEDTRDQCCDLEVVSSSPEELSDAARLMREHSGLSFNDSLSIVACQIHSAMLTTGDGLMRTVAKRLKQPVTGSIGLLDDMIRFDVIRPAEACAAIEKMEASDRRLPKSIIDQRRKEWGCESS